MGVYFPAGSNVAKAFADPAAKLPTGAGLIADAPELATK
jgi:hypothetical protein